LERLAQLVQKDLMAPLALGVPKEWPETKVRQVPSASKASQARLVPMAPTALLETPEMLVRTDRTARTELSVYLERMVTVASKAEQVPME